MKVSAPATALWALASVSSTAFASASAQAGPVRGDANHLCLDEEATCTNNPDGCCEGLVCSGLAQFEKCVVPPVCLESGHVCGEGLSPCCDDMACSVLSELPNGPFECRPKSIGQKTVSFLPSGGSGTSRILQEAFDYETTRNTRTTKIPGVPVKKNIACSTGDPHSK